VNKKKEAMTLPWTKGQTGIMLHLNDVLMSEKLVEDSNRNGQKTICPVSPGLSEHAEGTRQPEIMKPGCLLY
jgi:hypothetical protein